MFLFNKNLPTNLVILKGILWEWVWFSSVQFSRSVVSNSLQPHEPQHARPPCPSPTARVYPNQCLLSQWSHPTISSFVAPFSSCPQSFPPSGSFKMSQLFASGGQSIGVSASTSVLPMITQDWSTSEWTGWISLQSKGLSRVFSNTTVQKHQFFGTTQSTQSPNHWSTREFLTRFFLKWWTVLGKIRNKVKCNLFLIYNCIFEGKKISIKLKI